MALHKREVHLRVVTWTLGTWHIAVFQNWKMLTVNKRKTTSRKVSREAFPKQISSMHQTHAAEGRCKTLHPCSLLSAYAETIRHLMWPYWLKQRCDVILPSHLAQKGFSLLNRFAIPAEVNYTPCNSPQPNYGNHHECRFICYCCRIR